MLKKIFIVHIPYKGDIFTDRNFIYYLYLLKNKIVEIKPFSSKSRFLTKTTEMM